MEQIIYECFEFPRLGTISCSVLNEKIFSLSLGLTEAEVAQDILSRFKNRRIEVKKGNLSSIFKMLEEVFFGRKKIELEMLFLEQGTAFQQNVWKALREIPFGKHISYQELAKAINAPRSTRAVANACGANPFPLIIPCHRVIRKSGELGGFSAGVEYKQKLLAFESEAYVKDLC